jgi:hypothetical protein
MNTTTVALRICVFALALIPIRSVDALQRTFVSANGNDANSCALTAPCRGFARAMSQTSAGGEIVVLDSAGYGAFTIDRSVSVIAPPGVYAGITAFAPFAGVTVDAPGAKVALRGLTINGQGGTIGVWMLNGAELHVESCVINGLTTGLRAEAGSTTVLDSVIRGNSQEGVDVETGAVTAHFDRVRVHSNGGHGVLIAQSGASVRSSIGNSVISDNGGTGVLVESTSGGLAVLDIQASEIASNGWAGLDFGIFVHAVDAGAKAEVSVASSLIARNRNTGVYANGSPGVVHVSVADSTLTGNYAQGIVASGATVIAARNTVTRNATNGLQNSTGTFYSTGDNRVEGNFGAPTSGTISTLTTY